MNTIEQKWANYFDELGYDYLYKPEDFYLDGGWYYTPNFYLIDFEVICQVSTGCIPTRLIHTFTTCCKQYQLEGICLDSRKPELKIYEMIIPNPLPDRSHLSDNEKMVTAPKSTYKTVEANMVEDPKNPGQLMKGYYLTEEAQFKKYGVEQAIKAVKAANR